MITIIVFLAGFYFGIIVFSLLVMARKNINNRQLAKPVIIYHFRKADPAAMIHGGRSIDHGFRGAGNIL